MDERKLVEEIRQLAESWLTPGWFTTEEKLVTAQLIARDCELLKGLLQKPHEITIPTPASPP